MEAPTLTDNPAVEATAIVAVVAAPVPAGQLARGSRPYDALLPSTRPRLSSGPRADPSLAAKSVPVLVVRPSLFSYDQWAALIVLTGLVAVVAVLLLVTSTVTA